MLHNENMYKTVYFLDFKNNVVVTGRLIATEISENGYIMHTIAARNSFYNPDDSIVFYTEKEAEISLAKYKPINDSIIQKATETNKEIDALREMINGKPHFPEYAKLRKGK